ncbi:MAG TPA: hypothetical protein VGG48_19865 [Rhizomicrobium sp.]|jgi:hypothetical protein
MNIKTILLGTATFALLAGPAFAQDATKSTTTTTTTVKHHHHHTMTTTTASSQSGSGPSRLDRLEQRLEEQDAEIRNLKAQVAGSTNEAAAPGTVTSAEFEALQNQVYEQQAATATMNKSSWWANTKITGRFYMDVSNVDATGNVKTAGGTAFHTKSPQDGLNYDLKRAYLMVDHKFNDTYAANLTTDVTYDSATGASQIFIKKAYVQANYDPAFNIRLGSADLPWVPFVEGVYGYRYVENVLVDRTKFGTSADWGAHFYGNFDLGGPTLGYALSAINGFGYKAAPIGGGTNRSKGIDLEGRINLNWDGFVAAIGGYDGKLGKDVQNTYVNCAAVAPADERNTCHTAKRFDALLAYTNDQFRVGVEYFSAQDYKSVTSVVGAKGDGYSAFASFKFDPMWSVFGRFDWVKPTDALIFPTAGEARNKYYNFGISYSPISALDFALVYKHDSMQNGAFTDSEFSTFTCLDSSVLPPTAHGTCNQGTYNEIGLFAQINF